MKHWFFERKQQKLMKISDKQKQHCHSSILRFAAQFKNLLSFEMTLFHPVLSFLSFFFSDKHKKLIFSQLFRLLSSPIVGSCLFWIGKCFKFLFSSPVYLEHSFSTIKTAFVFHEFMTIRSLESF